MDIIRCQQLSKTYAVGSLETTVLKTIDLTIRERDFVGIIGPSGSGKSTLLYVLSGLEEASSGTVTFLEQPFSVLPEAKRASFRKQEIGFVFQFYNLVPNLTVRENIELATVLSKRSDPLSVQEVLNWVGLTTAEHRYPHQLSGGMQQRAAIARCLANRPRIIFADEPTGNLDTENGKEVMQLFARLNKETGVTIVLVTHSPDNLEYCNRVVRLIDGRIVADEVRSV